MTLEQENQADNLATTQNTSPAEAEIQPATWGQRFIMIGVAALIVLLDQWSKRVVEATIPYGSSWVPLEWLDPFFKLTHTGNTGATFGLFAGGGIIFTTIAAIVTVALLIYNLTLPAGQIWLRVALGLILGGAIGNNLIDRLRLGHVTDFLHFSFWPIFNIADMAIVGGAILMGWLMWQEERAQRTGNSEQ
jgi:signal peptidase II